MSTLKIPEISNLKNRTPYIRTFKFGVKSLQFVCIHSLPDLRLLTYLLTPWCRILLEKLTGFQLVSLLQLCSRNSASNSVCVNAAQRSDWDCDVSLSVCLGAFAKLRKATISCVISSRQHATTRLPLEGFEWNLIFEYFSKVWRESSRFTNIWPEKKNRYFTWISVQIYDNKGKVTPLQTRCGPEGG